MTNDSVRVRFAPSPTGYLHIGSTRTALFNWIFARRNNGSFLLRIEDTDKERSTQEYLDSILDSLKWLKLDWDEDIFVQSQQSANHKQAVQTLLKSGSAYKCFCSAELLDEKRKEAQNKKVPYRYDGTCRNITEEEPDSNEDSAQPYTIRCKVPEEGITVFDDLIHGRTEFRNSEIDDFIIMRRDGTPTYQLAVVVDDKAMRITHVIRGDDHLSNTPKQILLYEAFGWAIPAFAHMPMILGSDKARLSKRHGASSVEVYRDRGYLREAILNFLLLLGWSPGDDREIIEMDEVVNTFHLEQTSKKSAVFDERKLEWMNGKYISSLSEDEFIQRLQPFLTGNTDLLKRIDLKGEEYLLQVVSLIKPRLKVLTEFIDFGEYFYVDPVKYDQSAIKKYWKDYEVMERLARVRLALIECDPFSTEVIESSVRSLAGKIEISAAKLIHPTRLALTGWGVSPGLFEVMYILGRDTAVRRLEKAIYFLNKL